MTMVVAITTRAGKGTPLTAAEFDANLTNLKTAAEGGQPSYIQASAPTAPQLVGSTQYLWWDTSRAGSPTLWIEDGT